MQENKSTAPTTRCVVIDQPAETGGRWTVYVQSGDTDCPFTFGEKTFESQAWAERYAATLERVFVASKPAPAPALKKAA